MSKSTSLSAFAIPPRPGIIEAIELIEPSFFTFSICAIKSSNPNCPFLIFFAIVLASSWLMTFAVFSASEAMSPAPIRREMILSGIKISKSAIFSPLPINLSGMPIWYAIERAIPPLVSLSNLERITPSIPILSSKCCAERIPSCPLRESATYKHSLADTARFISSSSLINTSSIANRPALSMITMS